MTYGCFSIKKLDLRSGISIEFTSSLNTYLERKRKYEKLLIFSFERHSIILLLNYFKLKVKIVGKVKKFKQRHFDGSTLRSFILFGI